MCNYLQCPKCKTFYNLAKGSICKKCKCKLRKPKATP